MCDILALTYRTIKRKVEGNRDQLTPFSAPSGPARLSETYSSTTKKFRVLPRMLVCHSWAFVNANNNGGPSSCLSEPASR